MELPLPVKVSSMFKPPPARIQGPLTKTVRGEGDKGVLWGAMPAARALGDKFASYGMPSLSHTV